MGEIWAKNTRNIRWPRGAAKTFYEKSPHKFAATWTAAIMMGSVRMGRGLWKGGAYVTRSKNQHPLLFTQQFGNLFVNNLSKIMSKLQRPEGLGWLDVAWVKVNPLRPGRCRWLAFKHFITAIAPLKPSSQCEELKFHASWAHNKELPVSGGLKGKRDQAGPRVGVKGAQRQKGVWQQKGVQHMQSNLNVGHRLSTRSILHWEKLCINVMS